MGYSKEAERQNEVLGSLLKGETPEKRVMVGYEGVKESGGDKISHLTDIMKEARMPWFCPDCKKVMKQRLDDKFWRIFGHCFDCQIQFENKLRIAGTYKEWEENKIRELANNIWGDTKAFSKKLKLDSKDFKLFNVYTR